MAKVSAVLIDTEVLDRIANNSESRAGKIIAKLAKDTAADIIMNFNSVSPAPAGEPPGIDTGNLKNSIHAHQIRSYTWEVADGVPYGVMLEYGTSRMAARPFMGPAVLRTVQRAPQDLLKIVED